MIYAQCKRRTLELIFSYSRAGTAIPPSYNNQADYENRIPALVNQAQMEIATAYKPIECSIAAGSLTHPVGAPDNVYSLPNDCYKIVDGGLLRLTPNGRERVKEYTLLYANRIYIPVDRTGLYLEYFRYPIELPDVPSDNASLDNTPDAQEAVPFFAAAQLVLYDDAYRYTALMDEYRRRCTLLSRQKYLECGIVQNVYG